MLKGVTRPESKPERIPTVIQNLVPQGVTGDTSNKCVSHLSNLMVAAEPFRERFYPPVRQTEIKPVSERGLLHQGGSTWIR